MPADGPMQSMPSADISDASNHPLPMTLEDITPAWLTLALQSKTPGVTVRAAEIVDVVRGTCTKVRIRLDVDEAGRRAGIPERVILKGGFEAHSRHMAALHELEVRGYRDVLGHLGLPSPACYFALYRPDQLQGIVIMEDLSVRKVDFCDALRPQTFEQVAARLSLLARFHAKTWNSPELEGRWTWLTRGMPSIRDLFERDHLQPDVWSRFVKLPRGAAASVRFHDMEWARETLDRLVRLSNRLPHVVLHGDAHLGNTYIEPNGAHGFYDPCTQRDHAMRDVGYHLAAALDTADRRRWEGPLLQHYLDELARNGVEAPAFDEFLHIYKAYLALGLLIFLCNNAVFQSEAVNTANVARFSAAMIDHDTVSVLESIDKE